MAKPIKLPSGSWRIRWIDGAGVRHSETYPSCAEASYQLNLRSAEAEEIRRGVRQPIQIGKTFNQLADKYLECRTPLKRRQQDDVSIIKVHLRPSFGHLQLSSLNVDHFDKYKISKLHLHNKTVHHQLTLLKTMLNYAHDLRWIGEIPKIKKPKVAMYDQDFCFLKSTEEIERFLQAATTEGELVHALYATAVFTGMRAGELAGLKRSCVNFSSGLITIERSYSGPRKALEVGYAPILDPLAPILRRWLQKNPSEFVFPNREGNMQGQSARIFQEVFHRVLDRAGFPKIERHKRHRRYIVFHDLRHTFASYWVMAGGDIFKLQKILGHKSIAMTMRYSHLAPNAYSNDLNRFNAIQTSRPPVLSVVARTSVEF